jgi:tetratricopeptide (TPR) repeat protein
MKLAILLLLFYPQAGPDRAEAGATVPQVGPEELYERSVASVEASRWADAIAGFTAILEQDPSHTPSRFYLAVSFTGSGETDRAIETYREILTEDATVYEAQMNLGALLFESGQSDQAAEEFARAMDLKPEDPTPALYRAQVLDQSSRDEEAIGAYRAVLEIAGLEVEARSEANRRLGALYLKGDRSGEAREALRDAVRLGVRDPAVFMALGDLESNADNLETALEYYELAIGLDQGNGDLQLRLALILLDVDKAERAIPILEGLPSAEAVLGGAYLAAGRWDEAIPLYERLTAEEPDDSDYSFGLGTSYYKTNQFDRAIPQLKRTLELEAGRFTAWGTLASIYYQREDWVNAGTMLLNYLEIRPNHPPSIFLLATCYDKLGDYQQALLHYNLFLEFDDGSDDARSFQVTQRAQSLTRVLEDE